MSSLYLQGADVIIIKVEDCTGKKLEQIKINSHDLKELIKVFKSLVDKYSSNLKPYDWLEQDKNFKF